MLQALTARERGQSLPQTLEYHERDQRFEQVELDINTGLDGGLSCAINSLDIDTEENRFLLAAGSKGNILIYDLDRPSDEKAKVIVEIERSFYGAHKFSVECVQWFPGDTGMFLSSSTDQTLKCWDANTLMVAEQFDFQKGVNSHHISSIASKHTLVAVASDDARIYLCDLRSGSKTHTLRGHQNSVLTAKWSPRNQYIVASGGADHRINLWDVRRAKSCLMTLDMDNRKRNFDGKSQKGATSQAHAGSVNGLVYGTNGLHLISYGTDNVLRKWDLNTGRNTKTDYSEHVNFHTMRNVQLTVSTGLTNDVLFIPSQNEVDVCEVETGVQVNQLAAHYKPVNCCAYSPYYQELYTGGADFSIFTWRPKGRQFHSLDKGTSREDVGESTAMEESGSSATTITREQAYQDEWSDSDEEGEEESTAMDNG